MNSMVNQALVDTIIHPSLSQHQDRMPWGLPGISLEIGEIHKRLVISHQSSQPSLASLELKFIPNESMLAIIGYCVLRLGLLLQANL